MAKRDSWSNLRDILLVYFTALAAILVLPDISSSGRYLLGGIATIFVVVAIIFNFGRRTLARWYPSPQTLLADALVLFTVVILSAFAVLMWSIAYNSWPPFPFVNGYAVITVLHAILAGVAIAGLFSFRLAVRTLSQWINEKWQKYQMKKSRITRKVAKPALDSK